MKKIVVLILVLMLCACTTKPEIVYRNVYPNLPQLESPLTLATTSCHFSVPKNNDSIYIGFDEENFKCYLKNEEIHREQKLLYEKFIEEINIERKKWNDLNK